jgi:DNA-binding XRE family transcriptional regulator
LTLFVEGCKVSVWFKKGDFDKMKVFINDTFIEKRIKLGISVNDLAKTLKVTRQAIYALERKDNGINPKKAKKVAELFGMEFDDLFVLVKKNK